MRNGGWLRVRAFSVVAPQLWNVFSSEDHLALTGVFLAPDTELFTVLWVQHYFSFAMGLASVLSLVYFNFLLL